MSWKITDMNIDNIGDVRYTAPQPIFLPALSKFSVVASGMLTVWFCLRNLPEPAHHLIIDLYDDRGFINQLYLAYSAEVFARVREFWRNKTGQGYLPPGCFTYTTIKKYVRFESPDRPDGSPAILFRAITSINHPFPFWPHVQILTLHQEGSTNFLLDDNIRRLSGIRSIIINIPRLSDGDDKNIRKWISYRESSSGSASAVYIDFLNEYSDVWESFFEEMKDTALRVGLRFRWGNKRERPVERT
jgi:hypothetical protein